jgi:hypothetical protein
MHSRPCASVLLLGVTIGSAGAVVTSCERVEPGLTRTSEQPDSVALRFANALANRDYAAAHALTSRDYRQRTSVEELRAAFEAVVPPDVGPLGPVEMGLTMESWPDKQPADLKWMYVSIGGQVFSEAVVVVASGEDGEVRVRPVQFGRP